MLGVTTSSSSTTLSASLRGSFLLRNADLPLRKERSIILDEMSMLPTRPMPSLSSGTKDRVTPRFAMVRGSFPISSSRVPSSSMYVMLPDSVGCRPAMASRSSFWPLPDIPAIPRISPLLAVKETSSSLRTPSSFLTVSPLISILGLGSTGSGRSMLRVTG